MKQLLMAVLVMGLAGVSLAAPKKTVVV